VYIKNNKMGKTKSKKKHNTYIIQKYEFLYRTIMYFTAPIPTPSPLYSIVCEREREKEKIKKYINPRHSRKQSILNIYIYM